MTYEKIKSFAVYGVGAAVALGLLWVILKFALPVVLPFVLAYALSYAIRLGASRLAQKTAMNENVLRGILLALGIMAVLLFLWFGAAALVRQLRGVLSSISGALGEGADLTEIAHKIIAELGKRFGISEGLQDAVTGLAAGAGEKISAFLAEGATGFVSALPKVFFASAVGGVALLYFTFAYEHTATAIKYVLPQNHRDSLCDSARSIVRGIGRYARAYLMLISVTFAELLLGFFFLRVENAVVLALAVSIVDVLPVLGVGTVLIPWAVICFISGDTVRAIGLAVIFALISILRQPIESRLVGKSAGVHPVIALMAVYTGYFVAGIFGMITAPVILGALTAVRTESGAR